MGSGDHHAVGGLADVLGAVAAAPLDQAVDVALRATAEAFAAVAAAVTGPGGHIRTYTDAHTSIDPGLQLVGLADGAQVGHPKAGLTATVEPLDDEEELVLVRRGRPVQGEQRALLRDFTQAVAVGLRLSRTAGVQHRLRQAAEQQNAEHAALRARLEERTALLERLSRIQRSISHRAPLQEVFDAITVGAGELFGVPVVSLRLHDPADPMWFEMISSRGIDPEDLEALRRTPASVGVGGRAVREDRLVVQYRYYRAHDVHELFAAKRLESAMAAPIRDLNVPVGSLVIATYDPQRRYSVLEQEALQAFAEHASLAMTDAETVAALRDAQHAKDMFLAMVSHELKTPLTVVMGTLRTLERAGTRLPRETQTTMLRTAFERGRDLERLIDRLLQGSRAELASSPEVVELPGLVARAVSGFEASRPLRVGDVPGILLRTDPRAVSEIIGILLENAVSHAPADSPIDVDVHVGGDAVHLGVRNAGALPAGLDPRELFTPFLRGPGARSSGVGLGLSIASRLASAMGGRIDAGSGAGQVTFTLAVPYVPAEAGEADGGAGDAAGGAGVATDERNASTAER